MNDMIAKTPVLELIDKVVYSQEWAEFRLDYGSRGQIELIKTFIMESSSDNFKIGYWRTSHVPNEDYVCSECGGACWYYDVEKDVSKSRYCPNCGAMMWGFHK